MGNGRNFSLGNEFHWGPRRSAYAESFFLDFLPGQCRLIRRDGIRLFNIRYWANVLSPLTGRTTKPPMVKYDPRNLSPGFGGTSRVTNSRFPILT